MGDADEPGLSAEDIGCQYCWADPRYTKITDDKDRRCPVCGADYTGPRRPSLAGRPPVYAGDNAGPAASRSDNAAATRASAGALDVRREADALAGALDATGDELGRWVKKAEIYRQGLAEAVVRANTAEMHRDRAWQNLDTAHEDIAAMLRASGLGDHARPTSTHDVIRGELLPWIEAAATLLEQQPETGRE